MAKKSLAFIFSLLILFSFGSVLVFAADPPTGSTSNPPTGKTQNVGINIPNPLKHGDTIQSLLEAIINNILIPIGAVLAVLAFIYSGFLYVTAQGNETKIATAHKALLYTAVGTAVLLGAWVISSVIENTIDQLKKP